PETKMQAATNAPRIPRKKRNTTKATIRQAIEPRRSRPMENNGPMSFNEQSLSAAQLTFTESSGQAAADKHCWTEPPSLAEVMGIVSWAGAVLARESAAAVELLFFDTGADKCAATDGRQCWSVPACAS